MITDSMPDPPTVPVSRQHEHSYQERSNIVLAEMRARQKLRIKELGDALVAAGFLALDEQASALGLSRSTTWTILNGNHKGSGLSATIINRMLVAPQLPPLVHAKILEYVEEKSAGLYGDSKMRRRKFTARLSVTHLECSRVLAADRRNEQPLRAVGQRARRQS